MHDKWKSSVNEVNSRINKAHGNINALTKMDTHLKKEIYSNPTTKVDVVIRSKRGKNQDWSTMLSESNEVEEPNKKKKTAPAVRQKRFAQDTKSSKVKSKGGAGLAKKDPSKEVTSRPKTNKTDVDHEKTNDLDVKYPSRTLRIFLKEMRIAWENKEDRDQIPKILNDLEHIASKLDLDSRSGSASAGGGSRNDQLLGN